MMVNLHHQLICDAPHRLSTTFSSGTLHPRFQYSDHFVSIGAVIIIRFQGTNVTKGRLLKPLSSKDDFDEAIRDSASHSDKNEDDFIECLNLYHLVFLWSH